MRKYELSPNNGHKSFYGKAVVIIGDDGSATTGGHIKAFCGLNKAAYMAL